MSEKPDILTVAREALELHAKTTPSPWMAWSDEGDRYSLCRASGYNDDPAVPHQCLGSFSYGKDGKLQGQQNAAFCAYAHEHVAVLAQAVIDLSAVLKRKESLLREVSALDDGDEPWAWKYEELFNRIHDEIAALDGKDLGGPEKTA